MSPKRPETRHADGDAHLTDCEAINLKSETIIIALLLLFLPSLASAQESRPNILFIMADDHAVNAMGSSTSVIAPVSHTDRIEEIGEEGIQFTNAFVTNSICTPSRATILTGQYSHSNGVYILGEPLDREQPTVASILNDAGYETALYGKWHLLTDPAGFDDYKVLRVQGRYHDPSFNVKGEDEDVVFEGHSTDVITDMTLDFLKDRDEDSPFLLMTHYKAAHDPWDAPERFHSLYQNQHIPEPTNLLDTYENRSEAAKRTGLKFEKLNQGTYPHHHPESLDRDALRKHVYQQYIKDYLRCIAGINDGVGRILDYLKESGLDENTIVIYTSDQGHFLGEHGFFSKRFIYEESIRIPLVVRMPGSARTGQINTELITNADFAPTLLDMAGITPPESMQGRSFKPMVLNQPVDNWRTSFYYRYWQHLLHREVAAHYGIRTHRYKLIYYHGQPLGKTDYEATEPEWELFDLEADPLEMRNVYHDPSYKDIVASLKEDLLRHKQQLKDTDDAYPEMVEINQKAW